MCCVREAERRRLEGAAVCQPVGMQTSCEELYGASWEALGLRGPESGAGVHRRPQARQREGVARRQ